MNRKICDWISDELEGVLIRNDHKPAWEYEEEDVVFKKFIEELGEFLVAYKTGYAFEVHYEGMDLIAATAMLVSRRIPELKGLCRGRV